MQSKYQGRLDALQLLRGAYKAKKAVRMKDKYLIFDKNVRLALQTMTAWVSPHTHKQYMLGSLWLLMQLHLGNIIDYIEKVTELNLQVINIADRDEIHKYFKGEIQDSCCINQEIKTILNTKTVKKQHIEQQDEQEINKKNKIDTPLSYELQIIQYLTRFEKPINSRTRSLRCINKSFENIIKSLQQMSQQPKSQFQEKYRLSMIHQKKKFPIIIVPEFQQSGNISLSNVSKFLVDGQYDENMQLQYGHIHKIEISYNLRNKNIIFEVINNAEMLTIKDWQQVVGIFVEGHKNEFNGWPIQNPLQIFRKIKGFLLKYPNTITTDSNDWNIKTFILDKYARYRDLDIQTAIWTDIEQYLFEKIN